HFIKADKLSRMQAEIGDAPAAQPSPVFDPTRRAPAAVPAAPASGPIEHAMQLHQQRRLREAEAQYRRGLAEQPDHATGRGMLGSLLFQTQRPAEALPHLDRAIALRPGYAEAHAWRGLSLAQLGRIEEAAGAYQAAIKADPKHMGAHQNLGMALFS